MANVPSPSSTALYPVATSNYFSIMNNFADTLAATYLQVYMGHHLRRLMGRFPQRLLPRPSVVGFAYRSRANFLTELEVRSALTRESEGSSCIISFDRDGYCCEPLSGKTGIQIKQFCRNRSKTNSTSAVVSWRRRKRRVHSDSQLSSSGPNEYRNDFGLRTARSIAQMLEWC